MALNDLISKTSEEIQSIYDDLGVGIDTYWEPDWKFDVDYPDSWKANLEAIYDKLWTIKEELDELIPAVDEHHNKLEDRQVDNDGDQETT